MSFTVGDRVRHLDEDIDLRGVVVRVDGDWLLIAWDEWYGHSDQIEVDP